MPLAIRTVAPDSGIIGTGLRKLSTPAIPRAPTFVLVPKNTLTSSSLKVALVYVRLVVSSTAPVAAPVIGSAAYRFALSVILFASASRKISVENRYQPPSVSGASIKLLLFHETEPGVVLVEEESARRKPCDPHDKDATACVLGVFKLGEADEAKGTIPSPRNCVAPVLVGFCHWKFTDRVNEDSDVPCLLTMNPPVAPSAASHPLLSMPPLAP